MPHPAIRVENLGKEYQLGLREKSNLTFREMLMDLAAMPLKRFWYLSGKYEKAERIWALRDVSFEVQPGEVVGIIGRNGAGKSTLLKILTKITEPTVGRAEVHGHVGSLLEVGTGFHPELTGRENVFLNGAILGMPRTKIKQKFDEIVDFSGVEKFIDTPVKRYSSGMRVRLAFAVAAYLDPEILLIDEVLAVGDAEFQKKCLGKMGEVAHKGRTVLFVSHNMGAISALCTRCILLNFGRIAASGETDRVIAGYLTDGGNQEPVSLAKRTDRIGNGRVRFTDCKLCRTRDGAPVVDLFLNDEVFIVLTMEAQERISVWFSAAITDPLGKRIMAFSNRTCGLPPLWVDGQTTTIIRVPCLPLLEGGYSLQLTAVNADSLDRCDIVEHAANFSVMSRDIYNSGFSVGSYYGIVHIEHEWLNVDYEPLFS